MHAASWRLGEHADNPKNSILFQAGAISFLFSRLTSYKEAGTYVPCDVSNGYDVSSVDQGPVLHHGTRFRFHTENVKQLLHHFFEEFACNWLFVLTL